MNREVPEGSNDAGANEPGSLPSSTAAEFLAAIVTSSDDAIYSKDDEAVVTSWNPAAERLYGWTSQEAIGRPLGELIIPKTRLGEERVILQRILDGERVEHYETERVRKDGQIVQVSVSVSPVHDAEGRVVQAAAVARDITAQREWETLLAERDRRQALELNDEVIQGLAVAKIALETGQTERALKAMRASLECVRDIASELLLQGKDAVEPGDLVREEPAGEK